jgi:hypothetical protein
MRKGVPRPALAVPRTDMVASGRRRHHTAAYSLARPEPAAKAFGCGWLGTKGMGAYECRWDGLLWLAGRGMILVYIPSRKPQQDAQMCPYPQSFRPRHEPYVSRCYWILRRCTHALVTYGCRCYFYEKPEPAMGRETKGSAVK